MTASDPSAPGHPAASLGRLYRQFLPLFGGLFFCHLGIGISLSVLPLYVRQVLAGDDVAIGLAVTAIAVAVVVARPIAGRLADRHGYKPCMMLGALLCALAGGLYFLADSLAVLVVVRILHGVGEAAVFTVGATWLVGLAPVERRGKIVGLFGISMWSGITLGALAGTLIQRQGDFAAVWIACAVSPLAGLGLIGLKQRPDQPPPPKKPALLPVTALLPGIALSFGASGYAALAAFGALSLSSRGITDGIAVFNAYGFAYVGVRLVAGHWPDRFGPRRVAFWSALVEAAGLLLLAVTPNLAVGMLAGLIMGSGLSLLYPSLALMVITRTDKSQQGAALGTFTSFWDLGLALWGPATGLIAAHAGYGAIYLVTMACAAASGLLVLAVPMTAAEQAQPGGVAGILLGRRPAARRS